MVPVTRHDRRKPMMTLPFYALGMLCGLGAVVFAAAPGPSQRSRVSAAALFCIGAGWTVARGVPPPEVIGCLAAAGAAVFLLRPTWGASVAGLGGALAGVWSGVLASQGLTMWIGVPLALATLAAAMRARRDPEFAPPQLRDEALILICALALGTAMLPGMLDGWGAARSLTVQPADLQGQVVPIWTLAMSGTALSLGAGYALWSRR
jgi:hypothetical protein